MNQTAFKYSAEEAGRRGDEIYHRVVRPQVEQSQYGRIVAIDIETEDFAVADTILNAADELRRRQPNAQVWLVRVGFPAVHRFGYRRPYDPGQR